ncbi:MAG: hypothetical protein QXX36_03320 [Candidatus Rehaiarchaeum fermentans]|nr:hypothetical protein [Candidatus Rehaiarchaeum fermentans]
MKKVENTPQAQTPQQEGVKLEDLKKKLEEYVEDLEDLIHVYYEDFEDDLPAELESVTRDVYNADLAESEKEVVTLAADAMDEQVEKALENGKALREAYDKNDITNMLSKAVEQYANLIAINALLKYIKKYISVWDVIEGDLETFTKKASDVIAILANYIAKQKLELEAEDAEDIHNDTLYYHDLAENWPDLEEGLNDVEGEIESDTELKRGTYEALKNALKLMWEYYDTGLAYGVGGEEIAHATYDDEEDTYKPENLDVETLLLNMAETYAYFTALKVLYDSIVSNYATNKDFEDSLEEAIGRAKEVIDIILESYNNN